MVSLPTMTGATPLCANSHLSFHHLNDPKIASCTAWHAGWSLGVSLLVLWALFVAFMAVRRARRVSPEGRTDLILYTARLALVGSGVLTFLLYVISPDSGLFPTATSRYLVGMLISLPAVLWPLWSGAGIVGRKVVALSKTRNERLNATARQGVLLFIGIIYLLGTFSIFSGFPAPPRLDQRYGMFSTQVNDQHLGVAPTRALNERQFALIRDLQRVGARHIYSDYWNCNRLIFQSREQVICAVLNVVAVRGDPRALRIGQNRYFPYLQTVQSDPRSAVVFEIGSPESRLFSNAIQRSNIQRDYRYHEFDGYVVFQPLIDTLPQRYKLWSM